MAPCKAPTKRARSINNDASCGEPSKKNRRTDDNDGLSCTICFDKYTANGDHYIISLKCGHLFGNTCIRQWFDTLRHKYCPNCKTKAIERDIRKIYADRIVTVDNSENETIKAELQTLQKRIENLQALGIEYTECEICDHPFTNIRAKTAHKENAH